MLTAVDSCEHVFCPISFEILEYYRKCIGQLWSSCPANQVNDQQFFFSPWRMAADILVTSEITLQMESPWSMNKWTEPPPTRRPGAGLGWWFCFVWGCPCPSKCPRVNVSVSDDSAVAQTHVDTPSLHTTPLSELIWGWWGLVAAEQPPDRGPRCSSWSPESKQLKQAPSNLSAAKHQLLELLLGKPRLFWNAGYFPSRSRLKPVSETGLIITRAAKSRRFSCEMPRSPSGASTRQSGTRESLQLTEGCVSTKQDETCRPVFQLTSCWTNATRDKLLPFVYWNRCVCYFSFPSAVPRCPSPGQDTFGQDNKGEIKANMRLQESHLQLDVCHVVWSRGEEELCLQLWVTATLRHY